MIDTIRKSRIEICMEPQLQFDAKVHGTSCPMLNKRTNGYV